MWLKSDAWKPQATFATSISGISAASSPMRYNPKASPMSQFSVTMPGTSSFRGKLLPSSRSVQQHAAAKYGLTSRCANHEPADGACPLSVVSILLALTNSKAIWPSHRIKRNGVFNGGSDDGSFPITGYL